MSWYQQYLSVFWSRRKTSNTIGQSKFNCLYDVDYDKCREFYLLRATNLYQSNLHRYLMCRGVWMVKLGLWAALSWVSREVENIHLISDTRRVDNRIVWILSAMFSDCCVWYRGRYRMNTVSIPEQLEKSIQERSLTPSGKNLNLSSEIDTRSGIEGESTNANISDRHSLVRDGSWKIFSLM